METSIIISIDSRIPFSVLATLFGLSQETMCLGSFQLNQRFTFFLTQFHKSVSLLE